jgi:biotin transport system substrate-specific component
MNYKSFLFVIPGAFSIYLGALLSFPIPGSDVPVSMQTLAVILVGALLGPVRGGAAIGLYLIAGGLGLPVFAAGKSGVEVLLGPTGGFLLGFLITGVLTGYYWDKIQPKKGLFAWIIFLLAHFLILLIGFIWLNIYKGAWEFPGETLIKLLPGLLFKTAIGGLVLYLHHRFVELKK